MKKGQNILRCFLGDTPAAISREKSFKLNYSNEFEDSTTKDTPNGEKDEEFTRNNCSVSCDMLVGALADIKKFENYYKKGQKCKFQACETEATGNNKTKVGEPYEEGYIVFDSFDITSDDRANAIASFTAHMVTGAGVEQTKYYAEVVEVKTNTVFIPVTGLTIGSNYTVSAKNVVGSDVVVNSSHDGAGRYFRAEEEAPSFSFVANDSSLVLSIAVDAAESVKESVLIGFKVAPMA